MISLLDNTASIAAQNELNQTSSSLQTTLLQLTTGSRINSGADDPAGLSIANELGANITALQQSSQNANNGIGLAQTADGALSQVTNLLNRAVTIATEASTGGLSQTQVTALNNEFGSIKTEINNIGASTTFNGVAVFGANSSTSVFLSDATTSSNISVTPGQLSAAALGFTQAATSNAIADVNGQPGQIGHADTFTVGAGSTTPVTINVVATDTMDTIAAKINAASTGGVTASVVTDANGEHLDLVAPGGVTVTNGADVTFTSGATDLNSTDDAQLSLAAVNSAIQTVAGTRGSLGATINQLNAAVNVIGAQVQNLSSAQSNILSANIPQEVANLSREQILNQTGIAALSQANQAQQALLGLFR